MMMDGWNWLKISHMGWAMPSGCLNFHIGHACLKSSQNSDNILNMYTSTKLGTFPFLSTHKIIQTLLTKPTKPNITNPPYLHGLLFLFLFLFLLSTWRDEQSNGKAGAPSLLHRLCFRGKCSCGHKQSQENQTRTKPFFDKYSLSLMLFVCFLFFLVSVFSLWVMFFLSVSCFSWVVFS